GTEQGGIPPPPFSRPSARVGGGAAAGHHVTPAGRARGVGSAALRHVIRPLTPTGRTVRRTSSVGGALLLVASGIVISAQVAHAGAPISCDDGSLISAITTANGTPGGGTVNLPSGCTFTLTAV